jgi:hypothetical protein
MMVPLTAQPASPPPAPPSDAKPMAPPAGFGAVDRLDATNGFRGMKFGADSTAGLTLYQDRGALKLYTKSGEALKIGPVILEQVVYYFLDGKLYGVGLFTNDGQDSQLLLRIATFAWGTPAQDGPDGSNLFWSGRQANARFSFNTAGGQGELFISSNAMQQAFLDYVAKSVYDGAKEL